MGYLSSLLPYGFAIPQDQGQRGKGWISCLGVTLLPAIAKATLRREVCSGYLCSGWGMRRDSWLLALSG